MTGSRDMRLLVVDVGGTKTETAVVSLDDGKMKLADVARFPNCQFPHLEDVLDAYLSQIGTPPQLACLAVAGPVANGSARLTNRPWSVNANSLAARYELEGSAVVNDAHALSCLVPDLSSSDVIPLVPGDVKREETRLVVIPGTGLGLSFITYEGGRFSSHPSEGGNAPFAPRNAEQTVIWQSALDELGHVRAEDMCSGHGLERIFRHSLQENPKKASSADHAVPDLPPEQRTRAIMRGYLSSGESPICKLALDQFVEILCDTVEKYVLTFWATGGVYLAGGLLMPLSSKLAEEFSTRFARSPYAPYMPEKPFVGLITTPHPVLQGAIAYARGTWLQ